MSKSYSKIRHMQESNLMLERRLLISRQYTNGVISEEITSRDMDMNSKNWIYFVSIVDKISPTPRKEMFLGYERSQQQRLIWGGQQENYVLEVASDALYMQLDDKKDEFQSERDLVLTNWWKNKGYVISSGDRIAIKFGDAETIKTHINEFFKAYPLVGEESDSPPVAPIAADGTQVAVGTGGAGVKTINGIKFTGNEKGIDGQPLTYLGKVYQAYKGQLNFTDDKGNTINGHVTSIDGTSLVIRMYLGKLNNNEEYIDKSLDLKSSTKGFPYDISCDSLDVNQLNGTNATRQKNNGTFQSLSPRVLTFDNLVGTAIKRYCKAYFPKKVKSWGFDVTEYD
jgi:hypothetical protein